MSMDHMTFPPVRVETDAKIVRSPAGIILEDLRKAVLEQSGIPSSSPWTPRAGRMPWSEAIASNASGFTRELPAP